MLPATVFAFLGAAAAYHAYVYFWLCDDAYISFRYVRNLVNGYGIVYNPGERVEGYTNFAWVLELAALWKVLGINPEVGSVVLSVFCTSAVFVLAVRLYRTGPPENSRVWGAAAVVLFLGANRSVAIFTTSGLETRQFTMFMLLAVVCAAGAQQRRGPLLVCSLALAAAEYTRPDALLLAAILFAWYVLDQCHARTFSFKALAYLVVPYVVLVGAHFLGRHAYYGEWLPNTYYAKVIGAWPDAGLNYVAMFIAEHGLYLIIPLAALGVVARLLHNRDTSGLLWIALIGLHCAYVIRIGGDHFEFRMFDFYWPLLIVATVEGAFFLARIVARWLHRAQESSNAPLQHSLAAAVLAVVLVYSSVIQVGKYMTTYQADGSTYIVPKITPETFPIAFLLPGMRNVAEVYNASAQFCITRHICGPQRMHKLFWKDYRARWAAYEPFAQFHPLPKDAVWAVRAAGIGPYFLADITAIDTLGLNDWTIARAPFVGSNAERRLAHDRKAPEGYLESRGVNFTPDTMTTELPPSKGETYYALQLAPNVYLPFWSPDANWVLSAFKTSIDASQWKVGDTVFPSLWHPHTGQCLIAAPQLVVQKP